MPRVPRKKSFFHQFLKVLAISGAIGGVVVLASINPYFGIKAVGVIRKELKRRKWREINQCLVRFKKQGLAGVEQNSDGTFSVSITRAGQIELARYDLDTISINRQKDWDGVWRIFLFDIPVVQFPVRIPFRRNLFLI